MSISVKTYCAGDSLVHACSAKVKVALLAAYAAMLFFVQSWWGLLAACALLVGVLAVARVSFGRVGALLLPVLAVAACTILVNGFALDVDAAVARSAGLGNVSAGVFAALAPVKLVGRFGWYPSGFAQGCFYAARILLLVAASFALCFTTTSTALTNALGSFLRPLRVLHVPVDDVATMFSLALRFIPVTAEELERVRNAQLSRGAPFDAGAARQRLRAWQTVLVPLFVGMFRRADTLAHAMDARCYGASNIPRTALHVDALTARSAFALIAGLVLLFTIAFAF